MKQVNSFRIKHQTLAGSLTALALAVSSSALGQTLIWSDEFNDGQLDPNVWNIETGTGINGNWGTGQLDRATDRPENLSFLNNVPNADGGVLAITTQKEFYIDRDYTSGRINTEDKVAFGSGTRLSARVWPRDVRYQGQGFAFWLMPDDTPAGYDHIMWPQGGEIDIMEYVGSIPYHNLSTVHYAWFWEDNQYQEWNHGHLGGYYSFEDKQGPDAPEWLSVDLGQSMPINQVVLKWEGAFGREYAIQVSNDGQNWQDIYTTSSGDGGIDELNVNGSGRYVRMYGTARGTEWSYSLFEMEVYSGGNNVALNRPAQASSLQAGDLVAALAFDGQDSTRWSSALRNPSYGNYPPAAGDPNAGSSGFHVYSVDWHQDRLEFSIDDNVFHIHYLNDGAAFPPADGNAQAETRIIDGRRVYVSEYSNYFDEWHPFENNMYIILSAGVGGQSGFTYGGGIVPEAEFPASVLVDWVRVYSLDGSQPPVVNPPVEPPIEPPVIPPLEVIDLSTGKPAYASSVENEDLNAAAAFDADAATRWSSDWSDPQTLTVDLGITYTISRVDLHWEAAFGSAYEIQVSDDNQNWTTAASVNNGDGAEDSVDLAASGRYVRLLGTERGTGWGYSLWDMTVWGNEGVIDIPVINSATDPLAVTTASSVEGNYWHAEYATDGDANTRWASDASDNQWIMVDLGSSHQIESVVLNWEAAYGAGYEVQISDDGVNWQTAAVITDGDGGIDDILLVGNAGRYVRVYGTARGTGYGYSLWELEVYTY